MIQIFYYFSGLLSWDLRDFYVPFIVLMIIALFIRVITFRTYYRD